MKSGDSPSPTLFNVESFVGQIITYFFCYGAQNFLESMLLEMGATWKISEMYVTGKRRPKEEAV